jgi:hypothetical protein
MIFYLFFLYFFQYLLFFPTYQYEKYNYGIIMTDSYTWAMGHVVVEILRIKCGFLLQILHKWK